MSRMKQWFPQSVLAATLVAVFSTGLPGMAQAYVGPGAGLTAIGSVLALLAAIGLALVGFVWYPLKRLLRRRSAAANPDVTAGDAK